MQKKRRQFFFNEMNARMDKKCNAWIVGEVKENCDLKEGSRQEREPLLDDGLMLRAQMPCHMQKKWKEWW